MTTEHIDGIPAAADANRIVADSVRTRHAQVLADQQQIRDQLVSDLLNADIARRAIGQDAHDRLAVLNHEYGQTSSMIGQPLVVNPGAHHPLNLSHWSLLQWILAILLALVGLLVAAQSFHVVAGIFGNPMDDLRTVLKFVWATGWMLLGFGLGGLIGYALDNRRAAR